MFLFLNQESQEYFSGFRIPDQEYLTKSSSEAVNGKKRVQ
jgi:hypothetical protein